MTLSTAVLIAIYFMIVYGFFRLGQFYERVKMRKEEQKKLWETLSNGYIPKPDDPIDPTTYQQVPRRKYRNRI